MKRILYPLCSLLLLLAGLAACSQEEGGALPEEGQATLSLQVGAAGSSLTKAVHGDEYAVEGEFMHALTVFVCRTSTGAIVKKFAADNLDDAANWTSGTFTLDAGNYSAYAFANCGELTAMNAVLALTEGETLPETVRNNTLTIADPASVAGSLTEGSIHIPMSGKTEQTTVTASTKSIAIDLVRLTGKTTIDLTNEEDNALTVQSVTIANFKGSNTPLFAATVQAGMDYPILSESKELASNATLPLFNGYINETAAADNKGFKITVVTKEGNEEAVTREGYTNAKVVKRNQILPIHLFLSKYTLAIKVTSTVAPIGGYPVSRDYNGNYHVTLDEGAVFDAKVTLKKNGTEIKNVAWTHSTPTDTYGNFKFDLPNTGQGTFQFSGSVAAQPGASATIPLTASFEGTSREFTLTLTTKALGTKAPLAPEPVVLELLPVCEATK